MKQFIYADNAATTQLDMDAFEAMRPYLIEEYGNASQPYAFGRKAKKALENSREIIAECIGASPDEIFFTSGGTESDNWAIKGSIYNENHENEIITSNIEHHAILRACEDVKRCGYNVRYVPVDHTGKVCMDCFHELINNRTRLVSIMYANNEIGTVQDIKTLAKITHSQGAIFHTDAVQVVGHLKIDVQELGVDMLSASAHKFNGPKGIGFLYVRHDTPLWPFISGGSQEFGMRAGTENVANIVGMAQALKKNISLIEEAICHINMLEEKLLGILSAKNIDFVRNGSADHIPGNISLSFRGMDGEAILHRLDLAGICISTGSACDSKNTQISHVLRAIGLDEEYAKGTIRITLCKSNTESEILSIADALLKIVNG